MISAANYRDVAAELLARASREDGIRAAVLVELAQLFLAEQADSVELIGLAIELTKSLH
jgi:hypothetical protein